MPLSSIFGGIFSIDGVAMGEPSEQWFVDRKEVGCGGRLKFVNLHVSAHRTHSPCFQQLLGSVVPSLPVVTHDAPFHGPKK